MLLPLPKKHWYVPCLILVFFLSSERMVWAHGVGRETSRYLTYGFPFVILGAFIGCIFSKKNPFGYSIAGAIGGMGASNVVVLIITGDIFSFFLASTFLFITAIVIGLIVGGLFYFYRK